jgi:hypothetical protein
VVENFTAAVKAGKFSKAEKIIKKRSRKWSVRDQGFAWFNAVLYAKEISNSNRLRAAQLLKEYNVSWDDWRLSLAISFDGSVELARYLASAGLPLSGAAEAALSKGFSDEDVQFFLDKSAASDLKWAIHTAAQKRRWNFIPLLIAKADADAVNTRTTRDEHTSAGNSWEFDPADSRTALMFAAEAGNFPSVQALVQAGAKVNLRGDDGETAASLAYNKGETDIYNYLKANGAVDFDPLPARPQAQSTPAPAPSYGGSSSPSYTSTPAPAPVQSATWSLGSMGGAKDLGGMWYSSVGRNYWMNLTGSGLSGSVILNANGRQSIGQASISGDQLNLYITAGPFVGQQFSYTIVNNKLLQGSGENFYRY